MALEPTDGPVTGPDTTDAGDPLARALAAARREEPGWVEVSQQVLRRVRALVTPSDPIVVHTDDGGTEADDAGSRTYVASRVLAAALRRLLQSAPTHAPSGLEVRVEDDRLREVEVRLVASYRTDLMALADTVRDDVVTAVRDLVGPDPDFGPDSVVIRFEDVVDGDPREV